MILVDYSAVAIGTVIQNRLGFDEELIRHIVLNSLRSVNVKNRAKYGRMVLCMDSRSWRHEVFDHYKAKRRAARDAKGSEWTKIYDLINKITDEIQEFVPWSVVRAKGAEGDDCIAALAQSTQEFGNGEPVLIVAADSDYTQLLKYPNVEQMKTFSKKKNTKDPHTWLQEAIIRGQDKDGIPNIKSDDDVFVSGKRQTPITKTFVEEFQKRGIEMLTERELRNYKRNELLISFDRIPDEVRQAVLDADALYREPEMSGLLPYLISKGCRNLIGNIADFKPGAIDK